MATNTAPQWLKNTGVLDHSTLYLLDLCVVASRILYTINLSVTRNKHVSVNLVIPIHTYVQLAQCALRYIM